MDEKIYLDAGHGGYDYGASYDGRYEKDDNLKLALETGKRLTKKGMDVDYTRKTDEYQSPNEKAEIANENDADLLVSLHRNTSEQENSKDGVEAYVFEDRGDTADLARKLTADLSTLGFKNLGISEKKNLTLLKETKAPAIVLVVGYINSDKDNQLFDDKLKEIAEIIANGIKEHLTEEGEEKVDVYYNVQVGLFKDYDNAIALRDRLLDDNYPAFLWPVGGLTAVLVGRYPTLQEAEEEEKKLTNEGYETIIITI